MVIDGSLDQRLKPTDDSSDVDSIFIVVVVACNTRGRHGKELLRTVGSGQTQHRI